MQTQVAKEGSTGITMKVSPPNNAMMSNEAPPVEADHSPVPLCVCAHIGRQCPPLFFAGIIRPIQTKKSIQSRH